MKQNILKKIAQESHKKIINIKKLKLYYEDPFKHFYIDNFFSESLNGEARRSFILYYYTKEPRPSSDIKVDNSHSALWKKRGWLDKKGNQTRDFN